jgi:hypothetical protein
VSRIAFGLAVAGSVLVLWGISSPFQELVALIAGAGTLVVAALLWIVAVGKAVLDVFRDTGDPRWRWISWTLGVVVLTTVLVVGNVPWRARFAHSRPDLAAVAATAEPGLSADEVRDISGPRRVGTIEVEWIRQQGDAVVFATEVDRFGPLGVLYLPRGSTMPVDIGGTASSVAAMGDGWYWWRAL